MEGTWRGHLGLRMWGHVLAPKSMAVPSGGGGGEKNNTLAVPATSAPDPSRSLSLPIVACLGYASEAGGGEETQNCEAVQYSLWRPSVRLSVLAVLV